MSKLKEASSDFQNLDDWDLAGDSSTESDYNRSESGFSQSSWKDIEVDSDIEIIDNEDKPQEFDDHDWDSETQDISIELDTDEEAVSSEDVIPSSNTFELDQFRTTWQNDLKVGVISFNFSISTFFQDQSLVNQLLSAEDFNYIDLCQLSLVSRIFVLPARKLLFNSIHLKGPQQTLACFHIFQFNPLLADLVQEITIRLGDPYEIVKEFKPCIKSRIVDRRRAQNRQEPELYYDRENPLGILMDREGKQEWEENLQMIMGPKATRSEIEIRRRENLLKFAVDSLTSTEEGRKTLRSELKIAYKSYPFEPQTSIDESESSTISITPTLSFAFLELLRQTQWINSVHSVNIKFPATCSAEEYLKSFSSRILNIDSTNTFENLPLVLREVIANHLPPFSHQTTLSIRPDGQGIRYLSAKVEELSLSNVSLQLPPRLSLDHQKDERNTGLEVEPYRRRSMLLPADIKYISIDTFTLRNVKIIGQDLEKEGAVLGAQPEVESRLLDIRTLLGGANVRLTTLDLSFIEGISVQSIIELIDGSWSSLQHLILRNINTKTRESSSSTTNSPLLSKNQIVGVVDYDSRTREWEWVWNYGKKGESMDWSTSISTEEIFNDEMEKYQIPWANLEDSSERWKCQSSTYILSDAIRASRQFLRTLILEDSNDTFISTFPIEIIDSVLGDAPKLNTLEIYLGLKKDAKVNWDRWSQRVALISTEIAARDGTAFVRCGASWD